jgi:hypothetical protein
MESLKDDQQRQKTTDMKFLIFIGGLVVGILATILVGYLMMISEKPIDEGLLGLAKFPEKGECLKTTSKSKNSEIEIFQVIEPNMALGNMKNYLDKKLYGGEIYRDYDIGNNIVVLLINYDGKTYYDDQKIDVSKKCVRQIGTYQYTTKIDAFEKTVPAVVIE